MCEQRIAFLFVNIQTSALRDSISGLPVSREDVLASLIFFLGSPGCMQNFPAQGLNSSVLHWKCQVLTTGPPWKSEKMIEIEQKSWCIRARRAPGDHFIKAQRGDQLTLVHTASWSQWGLSFWPPFAPSRTSLLHWAVRTQPLREEILKDFFSHPLFSWNTIWCGISLLHLLPTGVNSCILEESILASYSLLKASSNVSIRL